MLTLFHAPQSRSSRLVWLLEEIGQPYEIVYCDIPRMDGTGARDPRNPHPDGKVPALLHDDVLVTESAALVHYLTELVPQAGLGAPVGSPERVAWLTWMAWITGELEPAFWARISGATTSDAQARARFEAVLARLAAALERGPWLMGQRFTAVDLMVASAVAWAREFLPQDRLLDDWLARATDRPANARATAKDSPSPDMAEVA